MINYAKIDLDNVVENIVVADDNSINLLSGTYVKITNETGNATIGGTWNQEIGKFLSVKPFPSWILDENSYQWVAPEVKPGENYIWNEVDTSWVELIKE